MILCISANPAIDRRLRIDRLTMGNVNRASDAQSAPGGKATHVALAAHALGATTQWIGFSGGATGVECTRGLRRLGIPVIEVATNASTRINLEIIDQDGSVTEILEPGGLVVHSEVDELVLACRHAFHDHTGCQVVISGSLPPGAPVNLYSEIIKDAHASECRVLLDTSGEALLSGLGASPDMVKPNGSEAAWATGTSVSHVVDASNAAAWMIAHGARSAAVSLGAAGIIWLEDVDARPLVATPPVVQVRSTVGCGDAALAGFAFAKQSGMKGETALRFAVACGTANCFSKLPGMISKIDVENLLSAITVELV